MPLFRVDPNMPFQGPHQNQPVVTAGAAVDDTSSAMILIHGRGASAQGMLQLAEEFKWDDIHYRALQANRHTWYPKSFLAPAEMNEPGISSGLQAIYDQICELNNAGIPTDHIILLGFSQGACLTTEFAARHPQKYGAIVGLSGGLIGDEVDSQNYSGSLEETPVFLGCSDHDPHIPKERVDETEKVFMQLHGTVIKRIYKGMGHTVNEDEIAFTNQLIRKL
ncbi:MAG TPA: dienelactone hydrolase family protein [Balneolaceae bacterium]|nr:dienelactone hydrolase family protein [Balneolaceae bacterium]